MDCNTAQLLASFRCAGRSELDPEQAAALEEHLQTCYRCAQRLGADQVFDQQMQRAMQHVPVPISLRSKIQQRLNKDRRKQMQHRFAQAGAIAASIVLIVGTVLHLQHEPPVPIDWQQVATGEDWELQANKEQVERWLAEKNIPFHPPVAFNYALLKTWGIKPLQGKEVPMLFFQDRQLFVKVYILNSRDFNLKKIPDPSALGSLSTAHLTFLLREDSQRPTEFAYLFVTNSESLEPFLDRLSDI